MRDRDVFGRDELAATGVVTLCDSTEVDVGGVVLIDATGWHVPRASVEKPDSVLSVIATNGCSVVVTAAVASHGGCD